MGLYIAHYVAAQIDRGQVLYWRVVVAAFAWSAIVCWNTDTFESALVYTVDINTLTYLSNKYRGLRSGFCRTQMKE